MIAMACTKGEAPAAASTDVRDTGIRTVSAHPLGMGRKNRNHDKYKPFGRPGRRAGETSATGPMRELLVASL
ncbi:hypothetical protein JCM25156A_02270 [Komagataeibacter kakiaceti JCM 25156]